jgi:Domain of unknown function (DUF4166)
MNLPLLQQVLDTDWQKLPQVLQKHYALTHGEHSRLEGNMDISYPKALFPMIWLIHLFGGLILWSGIAVNTQVDKQADATGNALNWQRNIRYPDGKTDCFYSRMCYAADHELNEYIGFGFGLRLQLQVSDGDLIYRGINHFWQWQQLKISIPNWLLLGTAIIKEHAISENSFYLDFTLTHPLWGCTYSYRGNFTYR